MSMRGDDNGVDLAGRYGGLQGVKGQVSGHLGLVFGKWGKGSAQAVRNGPPPNSGLRGQQSVRIAMSCPFPPSPADVSGLRGQQAAPPCIICLRDQPKR
jgi:hypothetical protein